MSNQIQHKVVYLLFCEFTAIIMSTQNCNYSLRYWSYFLCCYLLPTWPSLATLEGAMEIVQKCVSDVEHNKYLHCVGVTCEKSWSKQIGCADHKIWPWRSCKKQFQTTLLHKNVKKKKCLWDKDSMCNFVRFPPFQLERPDRFSPNLVWTLNHPNITFSHFL